MMPAMGAVLRFEDFPEATLTVMLFTDVQNAKQLREQIVTGAQMPECAMLNATLIPDLLPLQAAAYKALEAASRGALRTRSLHTELVCNLSGSKHIAESLTRFGINEGCSHVLVARLDGPQLAAQQTAEEQQQPAQQQQQQQQSDPAQQEEQRAAAVAALRGMVEGTPAPLERLPELAAHDVLRKYYKLVPEELAVGTLAEAIVCRVAARDC